VQVRNRVTHSRTMRALLTRERSTMQQGKLYDVQEVNVNHVVYVLLLVQTLEKSF